MYPQRELTQLAARKATLRRDIVIHRSQCTEAAGRVAQPLEWLERVLALGRRLTPFAPFAVLRLGLLVKRVFSSSEQRNKPSDDAVSAGAVFHSAPPQEKAQAQRRV